MAKKKPQTITQKLRNKADEALKSEPAKKVKAEATKLGRNVKAAGIKAKRKIASEVKARGGAEKIAKKGLRDAKGHVTKAAKQATDTLRPAATRAVNAATSVGPTNANATKLRRTVNKAETSAEAIKRRAAENRARKPSTDATRPQPKTFVNDTTAPKGGKPPTPPAGPKPGLLRRAGGQVLKKAGPVGAAYSVYAGATNKQNQADVPQALAERVGPGIKGANQLRTAFNNPNDQSFLDRASTGLRGVGNIAKAINPIPSLARDTVAGAFGSGQGLEGTATGRIAKRTLGGTVSTDPTASSNPIDQPLAKTGTSGNEYVANISDPTERSSSGGLRRFGKGLTREEARARTAERVGDAENAGRLFREARAASAGYGPDAADYLGGGGGAAGLRKRISRAQKNGTYGSLRSKGSLSAKDSAELAISQQKADASTAQANASIASSQALTAEKGINLTREQQELNQNTAQGYATDAGAASLTYLDNLANGTIAPGSSEDIQNVSSVLNSVFNSDAVSTIPFIGDRPSGSNVADFKNPEFGEGLLRSFFGEGPIDTIFDESVGEGVVQDPRSGARIDLRQLDPNLRRAFESIMARQRQKAEAQ